VIDVNIANLQILKPVFPIDAPLKQAYSLAMQVAPNVTFLDRYTPPHIVTLTLMAALAALNMAIFLPSLNTMATEFGTSYGTMQLAVSGYF
jgi:DHA1 family bicyclomycin/chloramphenicol resistance-like MFS transporter